MHAFTNRLIHESSPYLLQHAHNPVDWYPWGEEALRKAEQEQKPILVSIGYSACHWCHVMERESFENEETAALMNRHFINIKIDREERPDLDHIYMDAVQAMTGSGGWPLNVFLTPGKKPFYGGTYFPPKAAFNRPSWLDVLAGVASAFGEKRNEMESQAENLTAHLLNANAFGTGNAEERPEEDWLHGMKNQIMQQADKEEGGFGRAPKFPQTFSIRYLLRYDHFFEDAAARQQALLSLDKMCNGGIYDQIGGGFARYSVDNEWLAPHFEKMLYDNALLISVLCEACQVTGNSFYKNKVDQTIDFLQREMRSPEGGYYAALDADSEGVEGKFYTWSYDAFMKAAGILGEQGAAYYDVSPEGNWEHTNILRVQQPGPEFAGKNGMEPKEWERKSTELNALLMAERDQRIRPGLDNKILLSWNALMLSALCKAAAAFNNEAYRSEAIRLGEFLSRNFKTEEAGWLHLYNPGKTPVSAFLDDLANLARAFMELQEITGNQHWLKLAQNITAEILAEFSDENELFCYYTRSSQTDVVIRKKEMYDGAVPSGNAVLCGNLMKLGILFDAGEWKERAEKMLGAFGKTIARYPTSFGEWADCILSLICGIKEIAIFGNQPELLLRELLLKYIPVKVVQSGCETDGNFPLLAGKPLQKSAHIYLCENYACKKPVTTVTEFMQLVKNQ